VGPFSPATVISNTCSFSYGSGLSYAPLANALTSNNSYASAVHCGCCDANTRCLIATNFGFAIPAGAVITGITVQIEKRSTFGSIVEDNGLRLLNGGAEVGSNLANFGLAWPSSDTYLTYGGCNNLWGTTWTPAQINAANFGLAFASIDYSCAGNMTSFIDHIRVTVCYNLALPLGLFEFNAQRSNDSILLSWETLSEKKGSRFIIQKSMNGLDFKSIDSLISVGGKVNHYSTVDPFPYEGTSYYRIMEIDSYGAFLFSNVRVIHFDEESVFSFSNPVKNIFSYSISVSDYCDGKIMIFNSTGRIVFSEQTFFTQGTNNSTIDVTHLADGIYFVRVVGKNLNHKGILIKNYW